MRKIYRPTEKQIKTWSEFDAPELPSDEALKARWAAKHHNRIAGWGLGKRDWIVGSLKSSTEYQMGLWQARADFVQDLGYQHTPLTDDNVNCYNLGYYRGWNSGEPLKGLDQGSINRLMAEYGQTGE